MWSGLVSCGCSYAGVGAWSPSRVTPWFRSGFGCVNVRGTVRADAPRKAAMRPIRGCRVCHRHLLRVRFPPPAMVRWCVVRRTQSARAMPIAVQHGETTGEPVPGMTPRPAWCQCEDGTSDLTDIRTPRGGRWERAIVAGRVSRPTTLPRRLYPAPLSCTSCAPRRRAGARRANLRPCCAGLSVMTVSTPRTAHPFRGRKPTPGVHGIESEQGRVR